MATTLTADARDTHTPTVECLCPFCGSFHTGVGRPCSHCGTEDTTAARTAARKRVGPWFVLQTRNPAAPGMSFPALLAAIRSGRVTDRSVVRGPATGQLWRLAGKVRGVSREFGLCYACHGELTIADPLCPHCQRPQSLPADVDASPAPPAPNAYVPADRGDRPPPKHDLLTPRDVAKAFSLGFSASTGVRSTPAQGVPLTDLLPSSPPAAGVNPRLLAAAALALVALVAGGWTLSRLFTRPAPVVARQTVTIAAVPPPTPSAEDPVTFAPPVSLPPRPRQPVAGMPTSVGPMARPAFLVRRLTPPPAAPAVATEPTLAGESIAATDDPKQLMSAGLAAEARGDYRDAVRQYERIESLSSDQWPADLKDRLKLARRAARGDGD